MIPILHSVSYAGLWGQAAMNLETFIPHTAKLGYRGVMLMTKRPHLSPLDYDEKRLDQLKDLLDTHRLTVPCLAGYSDPNTGYSATSAPFAPVGECQLVAIRQWAQAAARLGAPILRLMSGPAHAGVPYHAQWQRSVAFLREACDVAADFGVTIGIQNHDDLGGHYLSLRDLIEEIDRPNCKTCFDAWSVALQDQDMAEAVKCLAPYVVHTTVADYVRRPRFHYHHPGEGNVYEHQLDEIKACPPGEGFIDYKTFFDALRTSGFEGTVAFEMCSPLLGGGSLENLDRYARQFLDYIKPWRT